MSDAPLTPSRGQVRVPDTPRTLGAAGDDLYAALLAAHEGLSDADSARLNARLVLLLMNAVGDPADIRAAIDAARRGLSEPES